MAKSAPIHCSVITPEEQILNTTATSVVIPAHDGQIGILSHRAPLLCALGTGVLKVDTLDAGLREFYVDGGFAQVLNNEVIVLTERAAAAENVSRADAEKALAEAEDLPGGNAEAQQARQRAVQRAKTQIRIAKQ